MTAEWGLSVIITPFENSEELTSVLTTFEDGSLTQEAWTHREHLAVACLYARRCGPDGLTRMREGIKSLNARHGIVESATRGYHETLTAAWMSLVGQLCSSMPFSDDLTLVNEALRRFADKRALLAFYSRGLLMSPEARSRWIEPDVHPLDLDELEVRNN